MSGLQPKMQVRGKPTSVQYKDKLSNMDIHKFYMLNDIYIFTICIIKSLRILII